MPRRYTESDYEHTEWHGQDWREAWWAPDSWRNLEARQAHDAMRAREAAQIAETERIQSELAATRRERHRRETIREQQIETDRVEAVLRVQMKNLKNARKRILRFKPLIHKDIHIFQNYDDSLEEERRLSKAIPLLREELRSCRELLAEVESDPELLFHVERNMELRD